MWILAGIAPATAFRRSGYFVETWPEVAGFAASEGILPSFLELDQNIPMVSTADVGQAAARLLTEQWSGKRTVELGGPEDWSARSSQPGCRRNSATPCWLKPGFPRR